MFTSSGEHYQHVTTVKDSENIELGVEFKIKVSVQYPISDNGHKRMLWED